MLNLEITSAFLSSEFADEPVRRTPLNPNLFTIPYTLDLSPAL